MKYILLSLLISSCTWLKPFHKGDYVYYDGVSYTIEKVYKNKSVLLYPIKEEGFARIVSSDSIEVF